jgi:hypothetical protein
MVTSAPARFPQSAQSVPTAQEWRVLRIVGDVVGAWVGTGVGTWVGTDVLVGTGVGLRVGDIPSVLLAVLLAVSSATSRRRRLLHASQVTGHKVLTIVPFGKTPQGSRSELHSRYRSCSSAQSISELAASPRASSMHEPMSLKASLQYPSFEYSQVSSQLTPEAASASAPRA